MILRNSLGFAALGCVLLSSCYPYNENQNRRMPNSKPPEKTLTTAEQQKLKEQRDRMKEQDALKKTEEQKVAGTTETPGITPTTTPPDSNLPKPTVEPKKEFAFANKVPGKEGFVFSPYNNKVVDVRDIPTGTLVQDPTYPPADKKYFRVP